MARQIKVKVKEINPHGLTLTEALQDVSNLLERIGIYMVERTREDFFESRWSPRINPNWPGIIEDVKQGKGKIQNKRFEDQPALIDSGRLVNSISHQQVGEYAVEFGTNLPYARRLQEGGRETIFNPIADRGSPERELFVNLMESDPRLESVKWLLKKPEITINIQKRDFIRFRPADEEMIKNDIIPDWLKEVI